jgi:PKD repeat protein
VGTSVASGQSVTFTAASATNPDGFPLVYTWVFSNGQANAIGQSVAVVMSGTGTVTATLQVRNSVGMLASGVTPTRTVTVTGGTGNQAPVASISAPAANVSIAVGSTVTFQGSGTDPDNNLPLTYSWVFTGGTPSSSTAQNPGAVTYNSAGSYNASFTVIDSLGMASAAVTRTVTVTGGAGNQPPVATIGAPAANAAIAVGGTVSFQGSGTDPDNNLPLTYRWVFTGGAPANSAAQNPGAVTYGTAGTFTASFTVIDSLGLASVAVTRVVTVGSASQSPTASIDAPAINVSVLPGGAVTFLGTGVSATNLRLTYRWTFAGGSPSSSTAQDPGSVRFSAAGKFTVTFVVTDSAGRRSAAATRVITVAAANQRAPTLGMCRVDDEPDDNVERESDDR